MKKLLLALVVLFAWPKVYSQTQVSHLEVEKATQTQADLSLVPQSNLGDNVNQVKTNNLLSSPSEIDSTNQTLSDKWGANLEITFVSRFIWRGLELGEYPSIQPNVTFSRQNFFVGIWSSHALAPAETPDNNITGYKEVIPYIGYGFELGEKAKLSLMVLTHYNPNVGGFLDYRRSDEPTPLTNRVELRALFNAGKFDFLGSVDVYNDPTDNVSTYLEFGYTFEMPKEIKLRPLVSVAPLASYYTTDGEADITQIGFITSRTFNIGDKVSLPVKIDMIYNPDRDAFYTAFGLGAKF